MTLKGKVAIVTGAGSGIGRASAEILGREGASVLVSDRDGDKAKETADAIGQTGARAFGIITDVSDDRQLGSLVTTCMEEFGRIDILHSHVGVQIEGSLEQAEVGGMDQSWRLNVRQHFLLAQHVVPHMKAQGGGSIIITASNSGVLYDREMIAYATTKHAVVAMTKQIALDYARYNIRVNALCPGWVDTPFNEPFMRQMGGRAALERYVSQKIPMGRFATAEEIAESVLFLASDRTAFMTGQALVVDGGESLG